MIPLEKLVSGGQSGADRAALDVAIALGVPHGGWCPRGRRAEDGVIDARYCLRETAGRAPIERTEWNVRDSDGTVIFSIAPALSGGSLSTREFAAKWNRPCLHLSKERDPDPEAALTKFIEQESIKILNVAGPRASDEAAVGGFVDQVLAAVLANAT